jgi:hypothetical protein
MTLAAWANVAEIIAALGVVLGFVFLTLELKENTDLTRAAAYDRSIDRLNDWRAAVIRDPDVSRLYLAYANATVGELNPEDTFRLQVLLTSLWGVYETAFYSYHYTVLGRSEWQRFEVQICQHREVNISDWNRIVAPRISAQFLTFIERSCRSAM